MSVRVLLIARVLTNYRLPVYERISQLPEIELMALHGPDIKNTKLLNTKEETKFFKKELLSFILKFKIANGLVAMPISPLLFFELIRLNPQVLICEGASNLFNTSISFLYKVLFRKKIIWWSLGGIAGRKKSFFRRISDNWIKYMERNSDAVITYSSYGKEYFVQESKVPDNKVFVAVNVVDTEQRIEECKSLDKETIYNDAHQGYKMIILFVGALNKEKKIDTLIEAFDLLSKKRPGEAKLIIVGDGDDRKRLEVLSKTLQIPNIEFTGKIMNGINKYFLAADIFVLPGLGGLAISDAMIHGLPVVASVGDGTEKDLIDGTNGKIIPDLNAESLYEYLKVLFDDLGQLQRMKESAFLKVTEQYSISHLIGQVHAGIRSVTV